MDRQLYHLTVNIGAFKVHVCTLTHIHTHIGVNSSHMYAHTYTHTYIKQELGEVGAFGWLYQRHATA